MVKVNLHLERIWGCLLATPFDGAVGQLKGAVEVVASWGRLNSCSGVGPQTKWT